MVHMEFSVFFFFSAVDFVSFENIIIIALEDLALKRNICINWLIRTA